jgi:hypothetical protein
MPKTKSIVESLNLDIKEASQKPSWIDKWAPRDTHDYLLMLVTFISSVIVVVAVAKIGITPLRYVSTSNNSEYTFKNETSGQLALTEDQLKAVVKQIGVPVYWAGPMPGAKYTLASQDGSRVYIRYLPDGMVPINNDPKYRVIATYKLANAFAATQKAGSAVVNGLGLTTAQGAAVYYNKTSPNNVYIAFPSVNAQVEIFDPNGGVALNLATSPGTIKLVE